jgi:hypothetical protein
MLASIYFLVLAQVHSCSKFDLTLDVIPTVCVASSCSLYFYMLYIVLFVSIKLIGTYIHRLDSQSTFLQHEIQFVRTYPPPNRTYPV